MWSAVNYKAFNSTFDAVFALDGTYRWRIEETVCRDWGIDYPVVIPVIAVGALTGLTGDYNAKYTYARKEGSVVVCESNGSNEANEDVTLADQSLSIIASEPTDPQVNAIRFYRTATSGATYYFDTEISYGAGDFSCTYTWELTEGYITGQGNKVTSTDANLEILFAWESVYTQYEVEYNTILRTVPGDNIFYIGGAYVTTPGIDSDTADASLGTELHIDHNRPPLGSFVAGPSFNGVLFILKEGDVYYSKAKQPEYWPSDYFVSVAPNAENPKCIIFYDQQPFIITDRAIYFIDGTQHGSYVPRRLAAKTGTASPRLAIAIEGLGIAHVDKNGIYMCIPSTSLRIGSDVRISMPFNRIFSGETINGVPAVGDLTTAWIEYYNNKLYFFYPGTLDTNPTNALVFYLDTEQQRTCYYKFPVEIIASVQDRENNRLLGLTEGYSWVIEDETAEDDDGTSIAWEVESMDFTLQTRRHFPRWTKYDIDASRASSAYGYMVLDGSVHQTHTITGNRETRRRLITVGNGRRCSMRSSGAGPVSVYMMESE